MNQALKIFLKDSKLFANFKNMNDIFYKRKLYSFHVLKQKIEHKIP